MEPLSHWLTRFTLRGSVALEATLLRLVVGFRVLGWLWMLLLVAVTFTTPDEPPSLRPWVVYAAVGLATIWTFVTWYTARRRPNTLASLPFLIADVLVLLVVGSASVLSNADGLFHGGMPMSSVFVGGLWGGLLGSLSAAVILSVEQLVVHAVAGLGMMRAAGTVVFLVVAAIVGWAFSMLRRYDIARQEAVAELAREQAEIALQEERQKIVARLHDSVLQTLHAIRVGADDPDECRYLARRQERELRRTIEELRSCYEQSYRARLLAVRDEVEDTHGSEIEAVVRNDLPLSPQLEAATEAAREAMSNAVKHSKASHVSLYSELDGELVVIHVKDNGVGFGSAERMRLALEHLRSRLIGVAGDVSVESDNGSGTDVRIVVAP